MISIGLVTHHKSVTRRNFEKFEIITLVLQYSITLHRIYHKDIDIFRACTTSCMRFA